MSYPPPPPPPGGDPGNQPTQAFPPQGTPAPGGYPPPGGPPPGGGFPPPGGPPPGGGFPPPGGGFPPPGGGFNPPPPKKKGMGSGAIIGIAAIVIIAILVAGIGVFVVAGGDDDGEERTSNTRDGGDETTTTTEDETTTTTEEETTTTTEEETTTSTEMDGPDTTTSGFIPEGGFEDFTVTVQPGTTAVLTVTPDPEFDLVITVNGAGLVDDQHDIGFGGDAEEVTLSEGEYVVTVEGYDGASGGYFAELV